MRRWLAVLMVVCVTVGCDRRSPGPSPSGSEPPGASAAPDYCPEGQGEWIAGRLLVPRWRVVGDSDAGDATPVRVQRREIPAPDLPVRLHRHGSDQTLAEGRTDAKGRWCLRTEDEITFGVDLLVETTVDGVRLRRPVITRDDQAMTMLTEALVRLLEAHQIDPADVSRAVYLNMEAMAATAVELVDPVEWRADETLEGALDRTVERLEDDQRLAKKLQRLDGDAAEP